jgi:hypothetical protein
VAREGQIKKLFRHLQKQTIRQNCGKIKKNDSLYQPALFEHNQNSMQDNSNIARVFYRILIV